MFASDGFRIFILSSRVERVLSAAFHAADAGVAVKNIARKSFPVSSRVFSFGLGKAACAMTQALAERIHLTDSLVVTKRASSLTLDSVAILEGNHPIPDIASLAAGDATLKFVSQLTPADLLVCLISGGGSALMVAPRIPLADLQALTSALLSCGATIDEINVLRRHLDNLKGGGLARFANGANIISLLLSDVVSNSIETIASGVTAPDPTTLADSLSILEKYHLKNKIPATIIPALRETLKPNDPVFERVQNVIIASNEIALRAAQAQAQREGFETKIINFALQGEARIVGREMAARLKAELQITQRPFCLLAGGETTVTLKGNGKGGRNQELALAAVDELADVKDVALISIATDGEDGPTDAAGAIVTGDSAQRAQALGISAAEYLSRNDAYSFFETLGDLIKTGSSGTNVNDLVLCFAF